MTAYTSGNRRHISGSQLKRQFVALLRTLMQRSSVRRGELVSRLGITASALTQFLNGKMIPSQARLDQLFELLRPTPDEAEQLGRMAFWLRAGRDAMPSTANRKLFLLRCQSGMTSAELAELTGIAQRRLNALENAPGSIPSVDETRLLAGALRCDPAELAAYDPEDTAPVLAAADNDDLAALPRIGADDLINYSPPQRIGDFAARLGRGFIVLAGAPFGTAAVFVAPAGILGLPGTGEVKLALGENDGGRNGLPELRMDADGGLRLAGDGIFATCGGGAAPLKWSLPLLKISYTPGERIK